MIRVYHITDEELKRRVVDVIAGWRGAPASAIPEWFEIDDAEYSEILIQLHAEDRGEFNASDDVDHGDR